MSKKEENGNEVVEFSYSLKDGNYIKEIYYEHETDRAVMLGRKKDDKILWIPKSMIKGGWSKDKKKPQNIRVNYLIPLYWKERERKYLEIKM